MRQLFLSTLAIVASSALSASAEDFSLQVHGVTDGKAISSEYAYCAPDQKQGANLRPSLEWHSVPAAAKSLAVIMVDPDVPTDFTDAGKEGKTIPADMKRQNFYHWLAFNIPTHTSRLSAGKGTGKDKSPLSAGKEWVNDYAAFHKDTPATIFTGYDGPCPPWNDARLHHYHIQLHALDVEVLTPATNATPKEVAALIERHSIAQSKVTGTYTLNKDLRP